MKAVIDRFEGSYAVCELETKEIINIERSKIPSTAREGTAINIRGEVITLDNDATKAREKKIKEMAEDLWQ